MAENETILHIPGIGRDLIKLTDKARRDLVEHGVIQSIKSDGNTFVLNPFFLKLGRKDIIQELITILLHGGNPGGP